jgi:hypothetical protein
MRRKFLFLLLILATSCELIVDVDVPFDERITANSLFTPENVFSATLHRNRFILDENDFTEVHSALVILYDENQTAIDTLKETTIDGRSKYTSDQKPIAGRKYTFKASAPNYTKVEAVSYAPANVPILEASMTEIQKNGWEIEKIFKIKFNDDPLNTDYYEILILAEFEGPNAGQHYRERIQLQSTNPAVHNGEVETDENDYRSGFVFNDALLAETNELEFKSSHYLQNAIRLIVCLRTLSEDAYKYESTSQLQHETSDNPFAQPAGVYSNIENGFGIFAGYGESKYVIQPPVPVITSIEPSQGRPGDHIVILGENFNTYNSYVGFSSTNPFPVYVSPLSITKTSIEVIVPQGAVTGKILIYTNGTATASPVDFIVIN